jgi:hypothetical protein
MFTNKSYKNINKQRLHSHHILTTNYNTILRILYRKMARNVIKKIAPDSSIETRIF